MKGSKYKLLAFAIVFSQKCRIFNCFFGEKWLTTQWFHPYEASYSTALANRSNEHI